MKIVAFHDQGHHLPSNIGGAQYNSQEKGKRRKREKGKRRKGEKKKKRKGEKKNRGKGEKRKKEKGEKGKSKKGEKEKRRKRRIRERRKEGKGKHVWLGLSPQSPYPNGAPAYHHQIRYLICAKVFFLRYLTQIAPCL